MQIPETGEMIDENVCKSQKIQKLIMFCLSLDPNNQAFRPVRCKALSLLLATDQEQIFCHKILSNLLTDQDKFIRLKIIQKISKNHTNKINLVDEICKNCDFESDLEIKQNILKLMVIRLN